MTDQVLRELSPRFERMYSDADVGRPSIPPEQLLRALPLQGLYTIRSERLLVEEIDYSILFRWFIGLSFGRADLVADDVQQESRPAAAADVASAFFDAVVQQAREAGLMSDEHFTVDGTVLEAWASLKRRAPPTLGPPETQSDDAGRVGPRSPSSEENSPPTNPTPTNGAFRSARRPT